MNSAGNHDPTLVTDIGSVGVFREQLTKTFVSERSSLDVTYSCAEGRFRTHLLNRLYRHARFLHSGITRNDGLNLYRIIRSERLDRTLEVGLAFGFTALFCLQAHADLNCGLHVAVDPNQFALDPRTLEKNTWDGIGISVIRQAGLESFFKHYQEPDFLALPELLRQRDPFDLCILDGMPLFDVLVMNLFYADMLLRTQGVLAIRVYNSAISKAILFWIKNRPYKIISFEPDCNEIFLFRKIAEDARRWNDPFHDF